MNKLQSIVMNLLLEPAGAAAGSDVGRRLIRPRDGVSGPRAIRRKIEGSAHVFQDALVDLRYPTHGCADHAAHHLCHKINIHVQTHTEPSLKSKTDHEHGMIADNFGSAPSTTLATFGLHMK